MMFKSKAQIVELEKQQEPIRAEQLFGVMKWLIEDVTEFNLKSSGNDELQVTNGRDLILYSKEILEVVLDVLRDEIPVVQDLSDWALRQITQDRENAKQLKAQLTSVNNQLQEAAEIKTRLEEERQALQESQERLLADKAECEGLERKIQELKSTTGDLSPIELSAHYSMLRTSVNSFLLGKGSYSTGNGEGIDDEVVTMLREKGINNVGGIQEAISQLQWRLNSLLDTYAGILKICVSRDEQ